MEECKYCDTGFPISCGGDVVCAGCGAEWADCAIKVEDDGDE